MRRHLWVRIAIVVGVFLGSLWYLYPPGHAINLGLDLQGGVHLVLGIDVEKAVERQIERAAEDLKGALDRKGVPATRVGREGREIVVQLPPAQSWTDALAAARDLPGFEVRQQDQAAGRFSLAMSDGEMRRLGDLTVRQGLETIRNRIDQFGVAEPTIARQGENRILIQLPGIQDPARAKALIGKTALLEFKLVDERVAPEEALAGKLPEGSEILYEIETDPTTKTERRTPFVVQKKALLTGAELNSAKMAADPNSLGNWQVEIEFNAVGTRIFGEVTEQNVGRRLAIILDGNLRSAPRINERIPAGRAVITGQFSPEAAQDLAIVLRAGALPAPVEILEERTVGPSLGADSIRQGIVAIVASAAAVFLFMLVYYRLSGLVADVGLALNLLVLLAAMAAFGATLTLPGIAGIALTIGMAVDTNILIFERIREELRAGKTVRSAIDAGFSRAFRTIVDTHVTVLVTALILYSFGTGPVKGFAVSLFVGIVASLFTAVFFTRLLFDLIYMQRRRVGAVSI
jgi:preprotein translocase subunit SecD